MAQARVQITVDLSLIVPIACRLAAVHRPPRLRQHLDALMREEGMVELQHPAPGSGYTFRAVPSVQLLRVLESYGVE